MQYKPPLAILLSFLRHIYFRNVLALISNVSTVAQKNIWVGHLYKLQAYIIFIFDTNEMFIHR